MIEPDGWERRHEAQIEDLRREQVSTANALERGECPTCHAPMAATDDPAWLRCSNPSCARIDPAAAPKCQICGWQMSRNAALPYCLTCRLAGRAPVPGRRVRRTNRARCKRCGRARTIGGWSLVGGLCTSCRRTAGEE